MSYAELIEKLEAMRGEVRGLYVEDRAEMTTYEATLTLARAVDALTYVVIDMIRDREGTA